MTATVIDLASRRPQPRSRETCHACRSDADGVLVECYPHRLDSLARRVRVDLQFAENELLIPAGEVAGRLTDVLDVIGTITDECLIRERGTR